MKKTYREGYEDGIIDSAQAVVAVACKRKTALTKKDFRLVEEIINAIYDSAKQKLLKP